MKVKKPFTLIELLVVISIIAVLASLLLPALSRAKQMAVSTDCINRYRQFGFAIFQYQSDNDEFYPANWLPEYNLHFLTQLGPYIDPGQDNYANSVGMWNAANSPETNLFLCPASGYQPGYSSSIIYARWASISSWRVYNYAMNVYFGWHNPGVHPEGGPRKGFTTDPSNFVMMGEIRGANQRWPRYDTRWVIREGLFRHPGESTNLLYLDGHAANAGSLDIMLNAVRNREIILRPQAWH